MIENWKQEGIQGWILSNQWLSVKILEGKGGDVNQITWLPDKITFLYTRDEGFAECRSKDLYKQPLDWYSDCSTGGWQDVIPGFGKYKERIYDGMRPVGTAACVGWKAESCPKENQEELTLHVLLPDFPLRLVKRFRLEGTKLLVDESVENLGDAPADVTWTQHAVFGGDFLEPDVQIHYPSEELFLSSLYAQKGGQKEAYEKRISEAPMPDGTIHDLRRMREHTEDGQLVFTMCAKEGRAGMRNAHKGLAFSLEWDKAVYPFVRCWYRNDSQGYAMALEPCNYAYSSYSDTDREGMYLHLEPGEIRSTSLAFRAERVES